MRTKEQEQVWQAAREKIREIVAKKCDMQCGLCVIPENCLDKCEYSARFADAILALDEIEVRDNDQNQNGYVGEIFVKVIPK